MYDVVGRGVVNDVLRGFNGTILAYGQTGSGKVIALPLWTLVRWLTPPCGFPPMFLLPVHPQTYSVFGPEETVERAANPGAPWDLFDGDLRLF